ncbi:MAG: hypothetical protein D6722_13170 [Bacteroidetes bacterium]|nr:MAG: hypothetical protein D6722_13170 [Bacteroidota bacterium]
MERGLETRSETGAVTPLREWHFPQAPPALGPAGCFLWKGNGVAAEGYIRGLETRSETGAVTRLREAGIWDILTAEGSPLASEAVITPK